jgi:uncharacterized protein YggU (UPF0235/DUF167 family)
LNPRAEGDAVVLRVRVQRRASRSAVDGIQAGVLRLGVQGPPVDGAANDEVRRLLARDVLGIAPSAVGITRGATGRDKVVAISGVPIEALRRRLWGAAGVS